MTYQISERIKKFVFSQVLPYLLSNQHAISLTAGQQQSKIYAFLLATSCLCGWLTRQLSWHKSYRTVRAYDSCALVFPLRHRAHFHIMKHCLSILAPTLALPVPVYRMWINLLTVLGFSSRLDCTSLDLQRVTIESETTTYETIISNSRRQTA